MARKSGSNGQRLDNHDRDIRELQHEVKKSKEEFDRHLERHILDDLQATRFPGSDKPMYTYSDIADRYNVSQSKVQRTAVDNNVTRRKNRIG